MTYSADQFPPGSDERIEVAQHSAGACCEVEDVLEDWKDYDEDLTADEKAQSWEHTDVDARIYAGNQIEIHPD
jgi:hypothetical protein